MALPRTSASNACTAVKQRHRIQVDAVQIPSAVEFCHGITSVSLATLRRLLCWMIGSLTTMPASFRVLSLEKRAYRHARRLLCTREKRVVSLSAVRGSLGVCWRDGDWNACVQCPVINSTMCRLQGSFFHWVITFIVLFEEKMLGFCS